MHSPDGADSTYEYTSPITIAGTKTTDAGGTQGSSAGLILKSPFGQEACEYALQVINFEGAGSLVISAEGVATIGPTNDGGLRGYMLKVPGAQAFAMTPVFTPLRNGQLYVSINMTVGTTNCEVTFLFRRARAEHIQQFAPMYHTADPANELAVNAARAQAIERERDYPSTPGRSGRGA
jgi:hypothetical protein